MGNVAITFRVMPEDATTDVASLKDHVRRTLGPSLRGIQEKDVAFGLRAILALAVVEDAAGVSEQLELALAAIPGVGSVEAIDVTLV